jgi:hypothetical protein
LNQNWSNASKQISNNRQPNHNSKNTPPLSAGEKERDNLTPTKDKSPDDLEISD